MADRYQTLSSKIMSPTEDVSLDELLTPVYWIGGNSGVTSALTNSFKRLTLDSLDLISDSEDFSLDGNVLTLNKAGLYEIDLGCSIEKTGGNGNINVQALPVFNSSTYPARTASYQPLRFSGHIATVSCKHFFQFTDGDTIEIQGRILGATSGAEQYGVGTVLSVRRRSA